MKSSTKTALIVVLAIVAAGGALAATYGLSNGFHGWVDQNVLHKDTVYIPKGAIKNDDGTITVKTSFAHQDKSSVPYTGSGTYYTLPDFEVSDYLNPNGKLKVTNGTFSNGEMTYVTIESNKAEVYLNLLATEPFAHAEDIKWYSDYDEALAKESGGFFYAPYANIDDFVPSFKAKVKDDASIEVSVTYVPKGAKFTGEKPKATSSQTTSSAATSSAASN